MQGDEPQEATTPPTSRGAEPGAGLGQLGDDTDTDVPGNTDGD